MALHPLLYPALGLLSGIWLADLLAPPAWPLLAGAAALGLALLLTGARWGRLPPWLAGAACLLLGAGLLAQAQAWQPPADHVALRADGGFHLLVADVAGAAAPAGRGRQVPLQARQVDGQAVRGLVRLSLGPGVAAPTVGRRVRARLQLRPFVSLANPGGFDYAAHMAGQGLLVRAYAGVRSGLREVGPGQVGWFAVLVEGARQDLGRLFDRLAPGPGRALARALVLGQRGELSARLRQAFGGLGTAHLLAISGLHLGLVWGLAFLLLRYLLAAWPGLALRWPVPQVAAFGALLPATGYAMLAGWSTPTLRALLMAVCLVAALLLGRPYRPWGGLALAALVIGVIWPQAPLGLSFQLSFVAVAAILLVAGPLARSLRGRSLWGRLGGGLAGWLLLSLVVGLAVWPLAARSFHQLPLLSVPANALLVPLVGMLMLPLALAGAALGLLWPAAGLALLEPAAWLGGLAADLALWLAGLPGAVRYVAGPSLAVTLLLYAAALGGAALKGRPRWLVGGGLALAALVLCLGQASGPAPDGRLTVWVLDVGQGSAVVARLPQGQVMVVDGGGWPGSDFDLGQKAVAPFLWKMGLDRLEVVAYTHGQADHIAGLDFLLRHFPVGALWCNALESSGAGARRLQDLARSQRVPRLGPAGLAGLSQMGGASLRVLWPPAQGLPPTMGENDRSLWLGLGLGRTWIWLPGDAGPGVEGQVAPHLPLGGQQAILAPHHGGVGSLSPELLGRLRPRVVVFSAGCFHRHAMPRPGPLARARAAGARVYTTASQGAIKLVSDGRTWRVEPFLASPRRCAPPVRAGQGPG